MSWIENPGVDVFGDLDLTKLKVDQCYVNVISHFDKPLWLYYMFNDCYKCPYKRDKVIQPNNETWTYNSLPSTKWRILENGVDELSLVNDNAQVLCDIEPNIGEFGVYQLDIFNNRSCILKTLKEPVNIYLPIIIPVLFFLSIGIIYIIIEKILRRVSKKNDILSNVNERELEAKNKQQTRRRVHAIDTFRGISIVVMIFVNSGAGGYIFMEHATWNGLNVADLVFPWFMWIMGTCVPIAVGSQLKKNVPRIDIITNIVRRACILFLLGLSLNTLGVGPNLAKIRIFGVFQRFSVCYLIVATLYTILTKRHYEPARGKWASMFEDISNLIPHWIVIISIIVAHTLIIYLLDVPGCPKGYFGPGGIQDDAKYNNCIGGATGYIDKQILGENHIYQHPTAKTIYGSGSFDPEGILGCLLSVVQVFLGVQAGVILQVHKTAKGRLCRWIIWAVVTGLLGGILTLFGKEEGWIPVNKNLWSLSFVLVTSCFAFILLSVCYAIIDVFEVWSGKPFLFSGMNSTIMYCGHSVAYNLFPFHWKIGLMNTHFILLIEALWNTCLWIIISYWLYTIKFFLSI